MKIQLKRSNQLEGGFAKEPTVAQMEYGELAVNYESSDPTIFYKDSSNTIRALKLAAVPDLTNVTNQNGTLDERYLNIAGGQINGSLAAPSFIGGVCRVSSTPPLTAEDGELWYNTDDGRTYIYFTDVNGDSQWVDQSPDTFSLTENFYNKTQSDARYLQLSGGTVTGPTTFASPLNTDAALNVGVDSVDLDQGVKLSPTTGGADENGLIQIFFNQSAAAASRAVFKVEDGGSADTNISFTADGSGTFAGTLTVDSLNVVSSFTADDAVLLNGEAASFYLDYNNFANTPTLITNNDQLVNGAGYVTAATAPVTSVNGQTGNVTINGVTNLGNLRTLTDVTITSSTGTNTTIGQATTTEAGLMSSDHHDKLDSIEIGATADQTPAEIKAAYESNANTNAFTDAEQTKLSGIAAGAQVNVATNLGKTTSTTQVVITSTTGTDVTIPEASGSAAGVMSVAHHNKLDGIADGAQPNVATDLSYSSATRVLASSTGNDVTLPNATTSVSGLLSASDKSKLNGIAAGATAVTDNSQIGNGAGYITSADGGDAASFNGEPFSVFARTNSAQAWTAGYLRFQDNIQCRFGNDGDCELFVDGSHMFMDLNAGIGNFYIRDGSVTRFTFDDNGSFTASGDITAFSDVSLKDDIEIIPNALDKVSQLRGVTFTRNDMEDRPRQAGVIAQEVEKVLPEVVKEDEQGIKSVAYGNLVGLLIEAIKELKDEIQTLKTGGY